MREFAKAAGSKRSCRFLRLVPIKRCGHRKHGAAIIGGGELPSVLFDETGNQATAHAACTVELLALLAQFDGKPAFGSVHNSTSSDRFDCKSCADILSQQAGIGEEMKSH